MALCFELKLKSEIRIQQLIANRIQRLIELKLKYGEPDIVAVLNLRITNSSDLEIHTCQQIFPRKSTHACPLHTHLKWVISIWAPRIEIFSCTVVP